MAKTRASVQDAAYRRLYEAGVEKVRKGEFSAALADFQAALESARASGRTRLQHEAQANLAMVYIQLGQDKKAEVGLREILLKSRDPLSRFGAAYNLAVSQRKQGRYVRAHFYARKAMESAKRIRDASHRAGCHNLLGNIQMNQLHLDEALSEYRKALKIRRRQSEDVRFSIAILLENIGYTYLLKKHYARGAALIHRALAVAAEVDAKRCLAEGHQDLCYAMMQMRRYAEATGYGERALAIAREHGYADIEKNCYYLLGETAHLDGRTEERDVQFGRLQALHPELPFLRDFLCAFDLTDIITLRH